MMGLANSMAKKMKDELGYSRYGYRNKETESGILQKQEIWKVREGPPKKLI